VNSDDGRGPELFCRDLLFDPEENAVARQLPVFSEQAKVVVE